jgi:HAD superfamily hydrolase (TIGR01509 family)
MASVVAVVFDVGETLIDETEALGGWADWLDVPRLTLFATLGAVIARDGHHSDALRMVRPGIDVDAETRARDAAGHGFRMTADDLYPDAMPCLRARAAAGIVIGIAGNQPASTETLLRAMDVPLALVASSQTWGVEKPDPAFFARICQELRLSAAEVVYVGDRLDNDVAGAADAGMNAVFLRRGPWAIIQSARQDPSASGAAATIHSLADLPGVLGAIGGAAR